MKKKSNTQKKYQTKEVIHRIKIIYFGQDALQREDDFAHWGSSLPKSGAQVGRVERSRLENLPRRTWVETAQGALFDQVLQSRGASNLKENLTAKWTKCSFDPMSTRRLPSSPSQTMQGEVYLAVSELHCRRVGEIVFPSQWNLTLVHKALVLRNIYK